MDDYRNVHINKSLNEEMNKLKVLKEDAKPRNDEKSEEKEISFWRVTDDK